jgi:hypothetical protein
MRTETLPCHIFVTHNRMHTTKVTGDLCVPLGSSTVQLHDNLGSKSSCACSEARFSRQNGYRRAVFCSAFFILQGKLLIANDINKETFPLYGGKCLSLKTVNSWVTNVSLMTKKLKRRCGSGSDNSKKTSVLRVSTD